MTKTAVSQIGKIVGQSINAYYPKVKPAIDEIKFKEKYQGRIIDCMVGEVDDNYIETPETDAPVVKLEYSKEGLVKVPSIKGKTILVDAEGNETDTPGEGCRLVSVGEDEDNKVIILSKNKNLFDGKFKKGYAIGIEEGYHFGDFYPSENYSSSINYISVEPNVTYRVNKDRIWVIEYDKYFKPIKFNSGWTTFVFDLNTKYIRFYLSNANTLNVQIEKNENITSYVPHQSHKTEILLDEPLREINGFIQDEIVDNMLYKNVGYKVIDSSLLTNMYIEVTNGYCRITTNNNTLNDWIGKTSNNNKDVLLYREGEKIAWKWNWNDSTIDHFYASNSNKTLSIIISQDKIDAMEGSNFREKVKKYFDKTKFEVFYNIKKIEELPNSITLQGFDDTTMYIENSITPTVSYGYNALIPYKQELLNQQEEVETNTLDIEQNIIPYLMDMEFNLMLMEDNE